MLHVNGFFGHAQKNALKSGALLAGFILLQEILHIAIGIPGAITLAERANGPASATWREIFNVMIEKGNLANYGWAYPILIGGAWVALNCAWANFIVRYETKAKPVERRDEPDLYNLVENLAMSIGLPCPQIEIIEVDALNAYASGFTQRNTRLALTRGLLNKLTVEEVEAVVAHELTHVKNADVRLMLVAKSCSDVILNMARRANELAATKPLHLIAGLLFLFTTMGGNVLGFTIFIAAIALVSACALLFKAAISQSREFIADVGAIELTKNPVALITALRKICYNDKLPDISSTTSAMMFSGSADDWLSSHPPVDERIAVIKQHANLAEHQIPDIRRPARAARAVAVSRPQTAEAFGQRRGDRVLLDATGRRKIATTFGQVHSPNAEAQTLRVRPPRPQADEDPELQEQDWIQRWILSGKADRGVKTVVGGLAKVYFKMPIYIIAFAILSGIVKLIGLPVAIAVACIAVYFKAMKRVGV